MVTHNFVSDFNNEDFGFDIHFGYSWPETK